MPWESALVERFVPRGADVLLVGSGSGRDALALAERGCAVTGIEPAGDAVRAAQRVFASRGLRATFVEGFFEDVAIGGAFDAVIFSFHAYAYFPESLRRRAALTKAASLLKPGGHVIVSHATNHAQPRAVLTLAGRIAGALARTDWRLERGDLAAVGLERPDAVNFVHAFAHGELEREVAAAGLVADFMHDFRDDEVIAVAVRRQDAASSRR